MDDRDIENFNKRIEQLESSKQNNLAEMKNCTKRINQLNDHNKDIRIRIDEIKNILKNIKKKNSSQKMQDKFMN